MRPLTLFLDNPECYQKLSCILHNMAFPKGYSFPDRELLFMHKCRYERPFKDFAGKYMRITITSHLGSKFNYINENCLLRRHPYFWSGIYFLEWL